MAILPYDSQEFISMGGNDFNMYHVHSIEGYDGNKERKIEKKDEKVETIEVHQAVLSISLHIVH